MKAAILAAVAVAVIVVTSAAASSQQGPPPPIRASLTTHAGQLTWNLDALLHRLFAKRLVCFDARRVELLSPKSGCVNGRSVPYAYTFRFATTSGLRLVHRARPPLIGVTDALLRIEGSYVSCPYPYGHSPRGWVLFGGGGPVPGAYFWCGGSAVR